MDETKPLWTLTLGEKPILATAIHDGHHVRSEVTGFLAVDGRTRRREEDPHTAELTTIVDTRLVVHRSRFELDVNRERSAAIYQKPADAWHIQVLNRRYEPVTLNTSLAQYDAFYKMLKKTLDDMVEQHGKVVVLDFHSYNYRRGGPSHPADNPAKSTEIELGINPFHRPYSSSLIDRFKSDLRKYNLSGRKLDVRENVRYGFGWMNEWINDHYPEKVCPISIELKKTFMDEWSGALNENKLRDYKHAFASTLPGLITELEAIKRKNVFR